MYYYINYWAEVHVMVIWLMCMCVSMAEIEIESGFADDDEIG